jgi:hypothetical protein
MEKSTLAILLCLFIISTFLLVSCKDDDEVLKNIYTPEHVSLTIIEDPTDKPLYIFLFTHTEDQFNHELSEDRYWKTLPLIEEVDEVYPELGIVWNIMFQGSDARAILERSDETGLVEEIQSYEANDLVDIGYHAHHDPAYNNRPQLSLSDSPTFSAGLDALDEWISCGKDPVRGGCIEEGAGGVLAVGGIGKVKVVSGVGYGSGAQIERGFGVHAIRHYLPDRLVGFGFPDHGATTAQSNYENTLTELMTILSPTDYTSGTMFWMDDIIRMNDGNIIDNAGSFNLLKGESYNNAILTKISRQKPNVMNAMIASKYYYTKTNMKTSPTKYAYTHPTNPELPSEFIQSDEEIEENYEKADETLYMLAEEIASEEGSKFVTGDEIEEMMAPATYFSVSRENLDILARYLLTTWSDKPANFATTGMDYYSLRDMVYLLATAISEPGSANVRLAWGYGPFEANGAQAVTMDVDDVKAIAVDIAADGIPYGNSYTWKSNPDNMLDDTYSMSGEEVTTSQLLYAFAYVYAAEYNGVVVETVTVPRTMNVPYTYELLGNLGCYDCVDTAWSLKPATFYNLVG